MAFHGGWLEEVTDDIAVDRRPAQRGLGVCLPARPRRSVASAQSLLRSHADSPVLRQFLDHVDVVVAVHGFGSPAAVAGGAAGRSQPHAGVPCRGASDRTAAALRDPPSPRGDPHARWRASTHAIRATCRAHGGVQIELPPRIRGKSPMWTGFQGPGRVPHHEALIEGLAAAARNWPLDADASSDGLMSHVETAAAG